MASDGGTCNGEDMVSMANNMLSQLHLTTRVRHWSEITASVFVLLFEGLCGEKLPDVIRNPKCKEDEIHNCQSVIDTLSLDVLNTSLSHITGEEVASGSQHAIANLLEVFSGLMEYILDKIGSDISTDNETDNGDALHDDLDDDPDLVTSELLDDILQRELGHHSRLSGRDSQISDTHQKQAIESWVNGSSRAGNSTDDLIALGYVDSSWVSAQGSPEKTADLIALGNSVISPPTRGPSAGKVSDHQINTSKDSKNSTAELIKESDAFQKEHGLGKKTGSVVTSLEASIEKASKLGYDRAASSSGPQIPASIATPQQNEGVIADDTISPALSSLRAFDLKGPGDQFNSVGVRPQPKDGDNLSFSLPLSGSERPRSGVHHTFTHHLYHHYKNPTVTGMRDPLSSSLPVSSTFPKSVPAVALSNQQPIRASATSSSSRQRELTNGSVPSRLTATAPAVTTTSPSRPVSKTSQSYENLENLMRDTVAYARAAVKSSPLKERPPSADTTGSGNNSLEARENMYRNMSADLRNVLHDVETNSIHVAALSSREKKDKLDKGKETEKPVSPRDKTRAEKRVSPRDRATMRQTNGLLEDPTSSKSILSPGKKNGGRKNVSFITNKSLSSSENSFDRGPANKFAHQRTSIARDSTSNLKPRHTTAPSTPPKRPTSSQISNKPAAPPNNQDKEPQTFRDYLYKYYGRDRLRSYSEGDAEEEGYRSEEDAHYRDGSIGDSDSGGLEAELKEYKRCLEKKAKAVRFDDILDDSAPGRMGGIRRKLKKEDQKARMKSAFIGQIYDEELNEYEDEITERLKAAQKKAKEVEILYKKKVLKQPNTKHRPANKYGAPVSVITPRRGSRNRVHTGLVRGRKRSLSASPTVGRRSTMRITDNEILPLLLEEFPFLHLSPETIHDMWRKSAIQIEQLSKAERELKRKKSRAQVQIEDAEKKQSTLMNIMKKELRHNQKTREIQERRKQVQSAKGSIREKRQQSARARKYYEEYQVRMRSKMLKKRSREEQVFKKLFKEGLTIQKDRIRDLRRYAREQRVQRATKQQDELQSLENYYKDQFAMLAESMAKEREELAVREKAQTKVMDSMKKELRRKMEREIKDFQEQLYRDEDEAYFRELDADRLRQQLNLARYQTKV